MQIRIRLAKACDVPSLSELITASVRGLQAGDYSAAQLEIALRTVYGVDTQLISDETYFAAEETEFGSAVACGLRRVEQAEDSIWRRSVCGARGFVVGSS